MKTTATKFATLIILIVFASEAFAQSVAINSTGASPNSKSILDLTATDKGLLIPRVVLNTNTDPISGTKPVGLLVYNNGGSVGDNGFYYWTGGAWTPIASSGLPAGTSGQTMRHDGSDWVANSNLYNDGSSVGIGTDSPNATLSVYEGGESTTKTNFSQAINDAGILITTDYTNGAYTPGVFWSTSNNNSDKPKAGIYVLEENAGSSMILSTSTDYSTGLTNDGLVIDDMGNIGIGTTDPSAQLHVTGNVKFDGISGGGNRFLTADNNGNLTSTAMGSAGDMMLANGTFAPIGTNAIENQTSTNQTGGFRINGNGIFNGGSVGIGTTSPGYSLHVAGTAGFDEYIYHNGDANTYMRFDSDEMRFYAGGRDFLRLDEGSTDELIVNGSSADIDFRVKGENDDNALFVEGSSDRVGIGTDDPTYKLDVDGDMGLNEYIYHNNDGNTYMRLMDDELRFYAGGMDFMRMVQNNDLLVINESNTDMVFKMEGDNSTDLFYVDGGSERVGIGTSNPSTELHVDGGARIEDLGGSGTRMVVTDNNGNLSTQAIPGSGGGTSITLNLTGDITNYNVSGVSIMYVNPGSSDREIKGLSGGVAGQIIYIVNIDNDKKVKLKKNVASQKFKEDVDIDKYHGAIILYTGSFWAILSKH